MNLRVLPPVVGFFDTRAPAGPPRTHNRLPNPVSISSMLNHTHSRTLETNRHSVGLVSIASMLNSKTPPVKLPRLVLTGMDIPDCDIPELEMGNLGEPAVKFTSINKRPNHFPSHSEDLELLATSARAYRFEPTTTMTTTPPPLQSELKSLRDSSKGECGLEPWVVSFINRYRPAIFSVDAGPSNTKQLFQRSANETGHGKTSNPRGVWPFSGILKNRRFRVRNRRSRFGSKILFQGEITSGLVPEDCDLSGSSHSISAQPRLVRPTLGPVSSFRDISDSILGDRHWCAPPSTIDHNNMLVTRFPKRSASFPLTAEDSESGFTCSWEEPMSDC